MRPGPDRSSANCSRNYRLGPVFSGPARPSAYRSRNYRFGPVFLGGLKCSFRAVPTDDLFRCTSLNDCHELKPSRKHGIPKAMASQWCVQLNSPPTVQTAYPTFLRKRNDFVAETGVNIYKTVFVSYWR